jgi:hypothetical protein
MENIKKELNLFLKNKSKIMKFTDKRTLNTKECEMHTKNYSIKQNIMRFITPFSLSSNYKKEGINIIEPIEKGEDLVIYVNGICSTIDMSIYQKDWFEKILKKPVTLCYNHTDGFILDIYECMQDRTYRDEGMSISVLNLKNYILDNLENYKKVEIIGYSQGCLITGRAIEEVVNEIKDKELLNKIYYRTFANPTTKLNLPKNIKVEHFINNDDLVANIGIIEHKKYINGKKYYQDKSGHLLIADYIIPLLLNYFNKESEFYKEYFSEEKLEDVKKDLSEIYFKLRD